MPLEQDLIHWLREQTGAAPDLELGIGDDAAVLQAADRGTVVTTDLLSDRVDFILGEADPAAIGRKALAVNLSDLAAMAAKPVACFVSLLLPDAADQPLPPLELAQALYAGLLPLADRYGATLAGGDTNTWGGGLVISVTALGQVTKHGPLTRSGAQPGDALLVTGSFGGSILGSHFAFEPRVEAALLLRENYQLHAGMDVSDGLTLDLDRLCKASRCGVELDIDSVPVADAAVRLAEQTGRSPLDHALGDGEDFELLLAVPAAEADRLLADQPLDGIPLTRIGTFTETLGVWSTAADGQPAAIAPAGYQHGEQE
ncbi:MAG: thiamine-phosphate kinase [Planctomycetota bacterium]